jgi:hypothetical protein
MGHTIEECTMRRTYCFAVCSVCVIAVSVLLVCAADADTPDTKAAPGRGIAVLASSIGSDYSPDGLAEFVKQGGFSYVVIDWAWITYHWGRTDFAQVNRLVNKLSAQGVQVAAMYRPRFLSNPTVATQVGQDGKPGTDHAEICYSDAAARQWGISWGKKILGECPGFKEIIIYNPLDNCQCPKCKAARANGQYTAVMGFLSSARLGWRTREPGVKLGVVYMPVPGFWEAGLEVVDVAHPFLCVREEIDPAKEVANILAVRSIVKEKMGSCLAKVTWEEGTKVATEKLRTVDDLAAKDGIAYFFWTFDTLFDSSLYDPKAVAKALGMEPSAISQALAKMKTKTR